MFGCEMRFETPSGFHIKMAPIEPEVAKTIAHSSYTTLTVTRYMNRASGVVEQDELEWIEFIRTDKKGYLWGVYTLEGDEEPRLIGTSGMHLNTGEPFTTYTTGSCIFYPEYWGKGIIGCAHKARTYFAFEQLACLALRSDVYDPNSASESALTRVGYVHEGSIVRNAGFYNNQTMDKRIFECVNPYKEFWNLWWRGKTPPPAYIDARARTLTALDWARDNVTL